MALKEEKEFAITRKQEDSVREETNCSFQHDEEKRATPTPKTDHPSIWEVRSTAVQRLLEKSLHQITL